MGRMMIDPFRHEMERYEEEKRKAAEQERCKGVLECLDYIRGEETNERTQETH